jgi:hypothetical protein
MMMMMAIMLRGEASRLSLIHPAGKGEKRKKRRAQWDGRDAKGGARGVLRRKRLGAKADFIMAIP